MATHLIAGSATFVGEWHVPTAEPGNNATIPGTLTWASERAILELHDTFSPLRGAIHGDEAHLYPAVHGTTTDSNLVSILDAARVRSGFNIGSAGIRQPEKIRSSLVIVGAHAHSGTLYSEIQARIPGLQIWLGRSGVVQTINNKTAETPIEIVYKIEGVPEETCQIASIPATLGWGISRNFSGDLISEIKVRSFAHLRIHCETPQNLEWFFAQLGKATTLLAMIAGSPMAPEQVSAKTAENGTEVEILIALRESQCCSLQTPKDFYMLRNSMEIDLESVFSSWYEKYESIAMPSQLALSVLSSKDLWLHVEFLSLIQALEGFHRATMEGLYTTAESYEQIKQSLSQAIPKHVAPDHKEALKSRIRYGNEISLRKRLDALVERLDLPLRQHILGGDGKVPRSWVETRNYYTHWDHASKTNVLDGLEMHRGHVRMRHLLRALYLDFVGIPQSAIYRSLENNCNESQYLIQLNSAERRKQNLQGEGKPMMNINLLDANGPDGALT